MSEPSWQTRRTAQRIVSKLLGKLYWDRYPDTRENILIAGTARSGTTWLAEAIASQVKGRIVFEPFNGRKIKELKNLNYFQYLRPNENVPLLHDYCRQIMTGRFRDPWTDKMTDRLFPRCRVLKAIRANLFLRWIHDRFPEVPILFVLRHPCAVVHSRQQLEFATDSDIQPFLDQNDLVEDFLSDKLDLIASARTPAEKHAVIWSISNLVPLAQFQGKPLPIVYYEHLLTRPQEEIPKIFHVLRRACRKTVYDQLKVPSRTSTEASAVVHAKNPAATWKKALCPDQITAILSIVEAFGLGGYYDDTPYPLQAWEPTHPGYLPAAMPPTVLQD